ncbi:bacteriophage protein [Salmonella enterica subsp. enterica serovar Havana]|nr:bacteriophage protein [Salmonella enterica subsp. enterica serovar Havana]
MLKPIFYSGSVKVPEYLETDKEKKCRTYSSVFRHSAN